MQITFFGLDAVDRRRVQLALCRNALEVWEAYAGSQSPISYHDSIVGMPHVVDVGLPRDAFTGAVARTDVRSVVDRYAEPIAALQDGDLELPDHIEFAWYAIYNLYQKYVLDRAVDDWLIVNQALSAESDPERWPVLLEEAINSSGPRP